MSMIKYCVPVVNSVPKMYRFSYPNPNVSYMILPNVFFLNPKKLTKQ